MPEQWRLILDQTMDGAANMAIDEAILEAVGCGDAPPTLRLFRWQPACLSLGFAQPAADADRARIAALGWTLVRRLTGGRAILHVDEITYSIALPIGHPLLQGSIPESYRRLSRALLVALQQIGLDANADKRTERMAGKNGPVCFEVPSDYEITAGGKKLIGSAQVRRQAAGLQHGSLPLVGDISRICDALAFGTDDARQEARNRVVNRATTLESALNRVVSWDEAADAIIVACEQTFEIVLKKSPLSPAEARCADDLRRSRYAADEWTLKS